MIYLEWRKYFKKEGEMKEDRNLKLSKAIDWYKQNRSIFCQLSDKAHTILVDLLKEAEIAVHDVSCRAKEVDSFAKKAEDERYTAPETQITDLSGGRIIAYVESDLEPIKKIIEENFDIDWPNSLDKSEKLGIDKVGYRSIHYICTLSKERLRLPEYKKFEGKKFEIQIRTLLQHVWAEVEHDRSYKFSGVLPNHLKRRFGYCFRFYLIDKVYG